MTTTVHEAEGRLGELIELATAGEEVVITRGGKRVARITPIPTEEQTVDLEARKSWLAHRRERAKASLAGEPQITPQEFWDEIRADRF